MVKLDAQVMRYMSKDEFRVLTAVEMGQKNHELVPTHLICRIAGLKGGGAFKIINLLHKNKLLFHESKPYDGYRLTYQGYDYLALKTFVNRGVISGIGNKIGVGKESDVYEVVNEEGESMVLKIHRLGRVSFRAIKEKRDYLLHRKNASWLYMSRLAAIREFAYMKALHEHGFVTPRPIDHNRHCVVMSLVQATLLEHVKTVRNPARLYAKIMNIIVKLADHGLIHCDFNEFNLLLDAEETLTMIDFPQMVSTAHRNAAMYFDRDVQCVRTFFKKRFKFDAEEFPVLEQDTSRTLSLDVELKASGCSKKEEELFEQFVEAQREALIPEGGALREDGVDEVDEGDSGSETEENHEAPEQGAVLVGKNLNLDDEDDTCSSEGHVVTIRTAPENSSSVVPASSCSSSSSSASSSSSSSPCASSSAVGTSCSSSSTSLVSPSPAALASISNVTLPTSISDAEDEGDEGDEPECDRRRRLKLSGPKAEVPAEIKERVKRVVAKRQTKSRRIGGEAKRNTQKAGRNRTKRFIKNELHDTTI